MKNEIYRAFLLALGTFQIIANSTYLWKRDGILLARRQHTELPVSVTDKQMKVKVILMLFFGTAFFGIALFSYITRTFWESSFLMVLGLFAVYACGEALYYRYWKTIGFGIVALSLVIIFLLA